MGGKKNGKRTTLQEKKSLRLKGDKGSNITDEGGVVFHFSRKSFPIYSPKQSASKGKTKRGIKEEGLLYALNHSYETYRTC